MGLIIMYVIIRVLILCLMIWLTKSTLEGSVICATLAVILFWLTSGFTAWFVVKLAHEQLKG